MIAGTRPLLFKMFAVMPFNVIIAFTIMNCFGCVLNQTIVLYPFRQQDCITLCTKGLISGKDTVTFRSQINFTNDNLATNSYFQIKLKGRDFKHVCSVELQGECKIRDRFLVCSCKKVDKYVVDVNISIAATLSLNDAILRGTLVGSDMINNKQIRSEEQVFPIIYESTNTTGELKINGKTINVDNTCVERVVDEEIKVAFSSKSQASPTLIEISTDDSTQFVQGKDNALFYKSFETSKEILLMIKYASCRLDGEIKTVKCRIELEFGSKLWTTYIWIVLITTVITAVLICIAGIFFRHKFQQCKDQLKSRSRSTKINDTTKKWIQSDTSSYCQLMNEKDDCEKCKETKSMTELRLEHLPFEDSYILDLVNVMADLTVMLTVSCFKGVRKIGTGWIGSILEYTVADKRACPCTSCKSLDEEVKTWAEIFIYTSTSLVDDTEKVHNIDCRLFFDSEECENTALDFYKIDTIENSMQKCRIVCVTCDNNLIKEIKDKKDRIKSLNTKINQLYKHLRNEKEHPEEKWAIIISHIHGWPKRVAFEKWKKKKVVKYWNDHLQLNSYTYTGAQCPGMAGAYVYILGRDHGGWLYQHLHVGVDKDKVAFSSLGIDLL